MGERFIVEYDADYSAGVMTFNKLVEADSMFEVFDHPDIRWGSAWDQSIDV